MNVVKFLSKLGQRSLDRSVVRDLLAKSDRELRDIGLWRGDVVEAVRSGVRPLL